MQRNKNDQKSCSLVIIGAGSAGLMAAYSASRLVSDIILLEKKDKSGRKLAITGGGRCNLTHSVESFKDLIEHYPAGSRFLYSVFSRFGPDELLNFFHQKLNLPTVVDRGRRVYPACENSKMVVASFLKLLKKQKVKILNSQRVTQILIKDRQVVGVRTNKNEIFNTSAVILATGGLSYPGTGSEGDGYKMAFKLGHTIMPLRPSLVGLEVHPVRKSAPLEESSQSSLSNGEIKSLQGLSLRNVKVFVYHNNELQDSKFGEMLFTHWGLSGPVILYLSRKVVNLKASGKGEVKIAIDLKPALSSDQLDLRIQRDFAKFKKKQFKNSLKDLLPQKLIGAIINLSSIDPEKPVSQITAKERKKLVDCLKNLTFIVSGPRPIEEAEVTQGGVELKEVDPGTMESKLIKGLYFAGEVLDIDGYIGGFNLQAAFSTGFIAGESASKSVIRNPA